MMSAVRGQRNLLFLASTTRYLVHWADAQLLTDTTTLDRQGASPSFRWTGRGPPG